MIFIGSACRIPMKTALLIIDMQNDPVRGENKIAGAQDAVPNVKKTLDFFRQMDFPVFHVIREYRADGSDVELSRLKSFKENPWLVPGTAGAKIIDELTPYDGEYIIIKNRFSAFFQTELDMMLRRRGIRRLVIAGVQTPNCIRCTAFDAISLDYETIIVSDAVGAENKEIHDSNLVDMQNVGAIVLTTNELIESIV